MSQIPSLAVVVQDGQVRSVIAQDWPGQTLLPIPPRVVVVDYDTDGTLAEELTRFFIGAVPMHALCRKVVLDVYEDGQTVLSPRAVLAALDEPVEAGGIDPGGNRRQTPVESSLIDYLKGYVRHDPVRRARLRDFPDWPGMARRELDRRGARLLEILPDDALDAIARGKVDLARVVDEIPD
jgi:hypothetical protein